MSFLLVSLILVIPVIEIWILIQIGIASSLNAVFILCLITAGAGWWFMRGEDFSIWTLIETELQNGRLPTEEILNDFLTWSSGLLLIVPGFLSDMMGLALLIPPIKEELVRILRDRMHQKIYSSKHLEK